MMIRNFAVAVALLSLAACGGSKNDEASAPASDQASVAASDTASAAASDAPAVADSDPGVVVTIPEIIDVVAAHFRLEASDLVGNRRTKEIAHARQVAMYLSRELTGLSLNLIGGKFGGRDHTTVMYGVEKIREDLGKNTQLAGDLQKLLAKIKG